MASAAPGYDGQSLADSVWVQWLRSTRSASCLALVSIGYRPCWGVFTPWAIKANSAFMAQGSLTPRPPQGGSGAGPSNI